MKNNKNTSIANKLEIIFQEMPEIDTSNTHQAIADVKHTQQKIETIALENDIPVLRAIIHWMALNTEFDTDNQQQIEVLLVNESYSNWIKVLAQLLHNDDFSLLPVLHQSLTSPDWIIRPSSLLLKGVASWLTEVKTESELEPKLVIKHNSSTKSVDDIIILNHQVSNHTLNDINSEESMQSSTSVDKLISEQIKKAEETNNDSLNHKNVFEKFEREDLDLEYGSNYSSKAETKKETKTITVEIPSIEAGSDSDYKSIDEELLAQNDTLVESLINTKDVFNFDEESFNVKDIKDTKEPRLDDLTLANFDNELTEIYQKLMTASLSSKDVFLARDNYSNQLDRIVVLTKGSSLEAISTIASWCHSNLVLFESNPTDEIKTFIRSGSIWSWISEIHGCVNDVDKNNCLKKLTNSLTQNEWLQPISSNDLEDLLLTVNNKLKYNNEIVITEKEETQITDSKHSFLDENSTEIYDMPQLIDTTLVEPTEKVQVTKSEKSGFQVTWDDSTHPELLIVYLEETPRHISELLPLLNLISRNEAENEEKVIASRLAHTIKGGSAIVGITALSEFCSQLEAILDYSKNHKLEIEILELLPDAGNCLQTLFDAVQFQLDEPAEFFSMYNTLENYATSLDVDDIQLIISSKPELPEFIIEQNYRSQNSDISEFEAEITIAKEDLIEQLESEETHVAIVESDIVHSNVVTNEIENVDVDVDVTVENNHERSIFQLNWNDDTHPELLMVYLEETPTQINALVPLMNKISDGIANAEEKKTASRMAHTIKGGSAIVGITVLSELAYRLESLLDHSIKHQLPNNILSLLPKTASCLEEIFDAIQMQEDEPSDFYSIFKQLDSYVDSMEDDSATVDEPLELVSPILPDFILNQNLEDEVSPDATEIKEETSSIDNPNNNVIDEIDSSILEEELKTTVEVIESISIEPKKLEKLENEEDVNDIINEMNDIVLNLVNITTHSNDLKTNLDKYSLELQRFDLLTEISGYPELSLISQWCQTNLALAAKSNDDKFATFVHLNEVWTWIECVGSALNEPDEISHLSSLSVELMRDDWAQAIEMDDLQTVLLALRNFDSIDVSNDAEYVTENISDTEEEVSWDIDIHPELLAVYFKETPDQISEVAELLHKISKGKSSTEENKKAARIAHTIKGASGVVGLNSLVELTHSLEDILDYSVNNTISKETAELLAEASDCMESLFETIQNKQSVPEDLESVLKRLSTFSSTLDKEIVTSNSIIVSESIEIEDQQKLSIQTLSSPITSDTTSLEQKNIAEVDINEAHIRVPLRIIDKLLNLAGELVTTSSQVSDDLAKSLATNKSIKAQDDRVHNMLEELSSTITQQEKDQHELLSSIESSDFDSLEMDSYNELHSVASLLSESFLDSQEIDSTLNKQLNGLSDKLRSLDKLNKDLSDVILSSRMISVNTIIPRLERIVRQTCRKIDKKAELIVTGNNINIDTDILNGLIDPLLHMLRNSIDHGIESPERRKVQNKDETGLIELSFTRDGNNILMSLKDDGAGINPETIYKKAVEKDLIKPDQDLSKKETLKLILKPGFSTQKNVTDISGRGVGMDVVNTSVESLNGSLSIDSDVGQGSTFMLTIPLTLITNNTLLVKAAGNTVAIPIDTIEQIIYQEANKVIERNGVFYVVFEDKELEIKSLGNLLEWSNQAIDFSHSFNVLIIKSEKKVDAIQVDSIISSREVVVKTLSPWISPAKGVVGACHLNDGGVAPVINLLTIVKNTQASNNYASTTNDTHVNTNKISRATPQILVVDDSLSNRKALSLIIDKTKYDVVTAVDGLDALQIMNEKTIDLVFTDLEMPRMNGIELTQAIRAWNSKSKTPIVMITSRTTNKHRELASKAGVDDYLTKPVVTDTLLDSINKWLVEKETIDA